MIEYVTIAETRQLQASGSILRAGVQDKRSPIAYGYDDTVALYFNQAPVFRVSLAGGGMGGRGGAGGAAGDSARADDRPRVGDRPRHAPGPTAPRVRARADHEHLPSASFISSPRSASILAGTILPTSDVAAGGRFAGRTKKSSGSAACSPAAPSSRGRRP